MTIAAGLLAIATVAAPRPGPDMHALDWPVNASSAPLVQMDAEHDWDALHYDLAVEVLPEDEMLDCVAMVRFDPTIPDLGSIRLDLRQLVVDSVWDASGSLSFTQHEDSVLVDLSSPVGPGDTTEVWLSYAGTPWNEGAGGWGGFWFHPYVYYHMGVGIYSTQPSLGRVLLPCWDHPADKATFDVHITVPDTLYAVSNGELTGTEDRGDGTTVYSWSQPQVMSTYLLAFSVTDYTVLTDSTYDWIKYYVYPWEVEDALGSFVNVDLMMDRFEEVFPEYPWETKFSYVETPKGDMEHATQVYHIAAAINGGTNYDWLLAHELCHQWWGNCVTEEEWTDVWLSEGFATYGEALWMETYGQEAYDDYMVDRIMRPYLNSGELFPLTEPSSPEELWSATTYEKGASVLHMLRHILGDEDFFASLIDYWGHHSFRTATTYDLRDHIENITGDDIDWFFDTWVWDWGYPVYDISYSWERSGAAWAVTVDLEQIQTVGPVFTMPLEFEVRSASEDTLVVMWNDMQTQSETFTVSFEPTSVEFDPGHNVLSPHLTGVEERPDPPPMGAGTMRLTPNPAVAVTSVSWSGMQGSPLTVTVYDLAGRALTSSEMGPSERTLDVSSVPSGVYLVTAEGDGNIRQTAKLIVR